MSASVSPHRGLGIKAGLDAGLARELAARCEELGYHSVWSNDEPAARGLDTLAQFAAATAKVDLGVGVLPLHRHTPAQIAAEVGRLGIDPSRLWLGIGAGALPRQIDPVQRAVAELRELLPETTRVMVAAMRPRLCRLGGAIADGVLLNWMPPARAAQAREWVREGAAEHGRPAPTVASYVRVAVGPGAKRRLSDEETFYRTVDAGHRRHFAALDLPLGSVGIVASQRSDLLDALAPYHAALELPIVRVLAEADATLLSAVADAAAP
jgi:alkanesulfonate monooxygenase SsuD/methylene tetrahydromethanopterin reductase-like flavin-dependent oxidoreductase (luciferase family)